jgi:hypothetical protein
VPAAFGPDFLWLIEDFWRPPENLQSARGPKPQDALQHNKRPKWRLPWPMALSRAGSRVEVFCHSLTIKATPPMAPSYPMWRVQVRCTEKRAESRSLPLSPLDISIWKRSHCSRDDLGSLLTPDYSKWRWEAIKSIYLYNERAQIN